MSQLFKRVKEKTGMNGNQIAKTLGESPELVSRWNRGLSDPNGINTLKLMKLGNIDRDEAMKLLERGSVTVGMLLAITFTTALLLATPTLSDKKLDKSLLLKGGRQMYSANLSYSNPLNNIHYANNNI